MKRRKTEEEHENNERWLITYADLITLLLAFFIMMYVFSKKDAQKYDEVVGHLKTIFTGASSTSGHAKVGPPVPFDLPIKIAQGSSEEVQKKLKNELQSLTSNGASQKNISVFVDERGTVVRILDKAFFDEGKADFKEKAKNALDKIVPVLKSTNNNIRIEGHTDNVPISTHEFRSNWELSVRRATEVVRYLIEKYDFSPEKISAVGYAEHRPIGSNDTAENRALNRRIEIIIIKSTKELP